MTDDSRFPAERAQRILALLHAHGRVASTELAAQFAVSEDSIRRDLRDLAAQGLCKRVYGGAVLAMPEYAGFEQRAVHGLSDKADLAALACSLLQPGQVLFLDAGTTNLAIAAALPQGVGLTVVTNAPQIAIAAGQREGVQVELIGGRFSARTGGVMGAEALAQLQRLRVDVCVPGACAVDPATGLWAINSEEAALKRTMVASGARVIVVASGDKLGAQATYLVAGVGEIDDLVVDALAPPAAVERFAEAGINVHRLDR